MALSDFFASCPWAVMPDTLEPMLQTLLSAVGSGAEQQAAGAKPAALSSASGNDRLAGDYFMQDGVAVIDVTGMIHRNSGSFLWFFWNGQDHIRANIAAAMADSDARAVLLSFNSPGGVAAGVKELADFIAAQTAKPIYAYADGLCASAAYWLASATGRVYAPLSATIGSIGVLHVHCDRSAANAAMGVRYTYVTGGKWKAVGNPDAPLSAADQSHLQETVTALHELFKADVAARMPVDSGDPAAWGDGQVFLAAKAQELGLVSGIVTDRDALIAHIASDVCQPARLTDGDSTDNKETTMNKEELAKAHPELLAQIRDEAAAEVEASAQNALSQAQANMLGMVRIIAGEDASKRMQTLLAAGLTSDQVAAFAAAFGDLNTVGKPEEAQPGAAQAAQEERSGREKILAGILAKTPRPVNTTTTVSDADPVQAAIDRISKLGV